MSAPRQSRGSTRREVARLAAEGLAQSEIARRLDVSRPTGCFHMRNLGIEANPSFLVRYDWDAIRAYYDAGHSAAQCRREFGFGVNAWADAIRRGAIVARPRSTSLEELLAAGRRRSRSHIKARVLAAGLKQEACERCGRSEWLERSLSLELHHVNGDGSDNRIANLQLLCPNCHSQTDSWGGRNKGRAMG